MNIFLLMGLVIGVPYLLSLYLSTLDFGTQEIFLEEIKDKKPNKIGNQIL